MTKFIKDVCLPQEAVIEKFVKYYKAIFHHNTWYFANFVMCELLNFVLLIGQFQLTDNFLNMKFRWCVMFTVTVTVTVTVNIIIKIMLTMIIFACRYGWDAFNYYYLYTEEERRSPEMGLK